MSSVWPVGKFFFAPLLAVLVAALMPGCAKEYDLERAEITRGTLGEELHAIWLKDTKRSSENAEERTKLLEERRDEFVRAVDRAVPPGKGEEFDGVLQSFLPVVEEGYLPALTRRIAELLTEAAADEELMQSLENPPLYGPGDFLSPLQSGRILQVTAGFEGAPQLLAHLGHSLADQDGLNDRGEHDIEVSSAFSDLLRALAMAMEDSPSTQGSDQVATLLRDLFLAPDPRYRGDESPRRAFVALFDDRGLPMVRLDHEGRVVAPFTDVDDDGLADVDEEGRFVLDDGQHVAIAPMSTQPVEHAALYRDVEGRVEIQPGQFAFEYVDLSETALPLLVRLISTMADEGALYHLSAAARPALGPTVIGEDDRGSYLAFDGAHPLVDVVDALFSGLAIDEMQQGMELTARYVEERAQGLAPLFAALEEIQEIAEDHPEVDIYANQTLVADLLEVFREILADPALWEDVMEALRDPILERGAEAMATLLRYADTEAVPQEGGPYDQCFQQCKSTHTLGTDARFDCIRACPNEELFSQLVDADAAESPANRSQFQRLFHLLRDTAGVEYSMAIEEGYVGSTDLSGLPPMVHLPGAAEAFIRAVAGELYLGDYVSEDFIIPGLIDGGDIGSVLSTMSQLFGAHLDPYPTPDQITRLFNQENLRFEEEDVLLDLADPRCRDGFVMAHHHADGLFVAEASGLIDVLHPLSKAFALHDREDLLARLFVIIHDHYASAPNLYRDASGAFSPMKASNLVSLEGAMLDLFENAAIFEAIGELGRSTANLNDGDGVSILERLRQLLHQLIRNDDGYQPRSGPVTIELGDGRVLESVSRLEVLLERAGEVAERVADDEETKEHLKQAAQGAVNALFETERVQGEVRFREEATLALVAQSLRVLALRAGEMQAQGTLDSWVHEEIPTGVKETISSRGFFALIRLLEGLHEEEHGRRLMQQSLSYFAADGARSDQVAFLLYGLIVQAYDWGALMPIGRFIVEALDPDREVLSGPHQGLPNSTILARVLGLAGEVDEQGNGMEFISRLTQSGESYDSSLAVVLDMGMRYFSEHPDETGPLLRSDREAALAGLARWLANPERGMEAYYRLVERRQRLMQGR